MAKHNYITVAVAYAGFYPGGLGGGSSRTKGRSVRPEGPKTGMRLLGMGSKAPPRQLGVWSGHPTVLPIF